LKTFTPRAYDTNGGRSDRPSGALLTRSHVRELGLERRAVDVFRMSGRLPPVCTAGVRAEATPRRAHFAALVVRDRFRM